MTDLLTVSEVAAVLRVSEDTVTKRFQDRAGVVDLGQKENLRSRRRRYRVLRIPRSVLETFIKERTR